MEEPTNNPHMELLNGITFHLCDINKLMIEEWKYYFDGFSNFKFHNCDVSELNIMPNSINAIVSSTNSFGDLRGDIDNKFGCGLKEQLQQAIIKHKFGELVVGDALILPITNNNACKYHYLISAPIMRIPMNIRHTANAYLAFRAVLIELIKFNLDPHNHNNKINNIVCPGFGTGIGQMTTDVCAKQMFKAYNIIINPNCDLDLYKLAYDHVETIKES